jgi:two-component system phosphate regulon sensor histidine kinase PhoR
MTITFLEGLPFQRLLPPLGTAGWIAWFAFVAVAAWLLWRLRAHQTALGRQQLAWLAGLAILSPILILLFAVRLPADGALPIPALGPPALGLLMPVFIALPWVIGVIVLGPLPGAALAAWAGLLLAVWDTRSFFTPIEFAILAALFAAGVTQNYRSRFYDWVRQPLVSALLVALAAPFLYALSSLFWAASDPVAALDFAISRWPSVTVAFGAPLLVAALGVQLARMRLPALAGKSGPARPAPSERSLEARLLFSLGPVVLLAFLALGALGWWSAGRAAEQLLGERVQASAQIAADNVPFFLETGQNLILQLASDQRLADASRETALAILQQHLRTVPYFEQLVLLDTGGNTIAGYPVADFLGLQPSADEVTAVALAVQGVSLQFLSVPPLQETSNAAQLSFVAAVRNENGQVRAVLVGRTGLTSNPFVQPILQSLQSVNALGGQGILLDGQGRIVMAPSAAAIMQPYNGRTSTTLLTYEDSSSDGSRRFVNYQPVTGSAWAVVTQWPARLSQQLALQIALPILAVLLLLAVVAYLMLRFSLRSVTSSLQELVGETRRIASGDLRAPLTIRSEDEVGRLGTAFETMRQTLQSRVEEIQRLLTVSQGVSSNLDSGVHIQPILDAALASGASAARLVFGAADGKGLVGFGRGAGQRAQQYLDEQVNELTRKQARVLLTNPARAQLKAAKGTQLPQSVAGFALQSNGEHLGTLWLAYETPQIFAPDAVRYLESLAEQAAKAVVNARLYTTASLARQRLEAVLHSDPDPLLVLDESQRVVFANAAAQQTLAPASGSLVGLVITELIGAQALAGVLQSSRQQGSEVQIATRTYNASASLIQQDSQPLGIVLSLRDTSQAKRADTARTDFLTTLSHDLHDPLDMTRGYLNMLGMVGDLNPQQQGYVQKMEHNLENISRLASNLLDIERVSGLKSLQMQSFSMPDLVREVCDDLAARARQKRVEFSLKSGNGPALQADRTLLQRALHNLIDNAIKFSPREGIVDVKTSYVNDRVKVAVMDQGGGIAPLDLPYLFEARQGQRSSTGLAIVKSILERHGGRVWAESELGTGSIFYLELPLDSASPS